MAEIVLVAGATGALGMQVAGVLREAGYRVRALGRSAQRLERMRAQVDEVRTADALDASSLRGVCDGVGTVISTVGASLQPSMKFGRATYSRVDVPANRNLIAEAKRAGVGKFVYVSLVKAPNLEQLDYVAAHEMVVEELASSGMKHCVIRPTGFFSVYAELLKMARKGMFLPLFDDGSARTNAIHDRDVAEVCVSAIKSDEREVSAGGPVIHSRREIAQMAFAAVGRRPRILRVPAWTARLGSLAIRPISPRISALVDFVVAVYRQDIIAPITGSRTLEAYFAELARSKR